MPTRADREKYGKGGRPYPVTKVYVRPMSWSLDDKGFETASWILINEKEGVRMHVNSYSGKLGSELVPVANVLPSPNDKKWRKKLREFREVTIDECPFAIPEGQSEVPLSDLVQRSNSFEFERQSRAGGEERPVLDAPQSYPGTVSPPSEGRPQQETHEPEGAREMPEYRRSA